MKEGRDEGRGDEGREGEKEGKGEEFEFYYN